MSSYAHQHVMEDHLARSRIKGILLRISEEEKFISKLALIGFMQGNTLAMVLVAIVMV